MRIGITIDSVFLSHFNLNMPTITCKKYSTINRQTFYITILNKLKECYCRLLIIDTEKCIAVKSLEAVAGGSIYFKDTLYIVIRVS